MNPDALLEAARRFIHDAPEGTEGLWARACALLTRQALEVAIKIRISKRIHHVEDLSFQSQLLCLHDFTDAKTARRAAFAWSALSSATHHHGYELPPTASALEGWLGTVSDVVATLDS